ncbi:hypothetical protein JCM17823_10320 [Halorubrum gandharaense]
MSRLLPSPPDLTPDDRDPRVVGVDDDEADDLIAALGSETARNVLTTLHEEPATTSEIADELNTSLQNVQYHLGKLTDADLVDVVDTAYSEKGREMNVYAPADEPLVLFAGGSTSSGGIRTALKRLLGGYAVLGLAALAAQRLLSVAAPDGTTGADGYAVEQGGDDAADGPTVAEDDVADADADATGEAVEAETPAAETDDADADGFEVSFDGDAAERADMAAEYALSLVEPGVVFFLGAGLVFTLAWVYWYRSEWRELR